MAYLATPKLSYRKVVAALVESEERYRLLVEGVRGYAIFMLDPDGMIVTWNYGIYELLGYTREDILGHTGAMVFNASDRADGTFKKHLANARRFGESIRNHLNVCKDGTELLVNETVTALRDSAGVLLGYAKVTRSCDVGTVSANSDSAVELAKSLARIQGEVEQRSRLEAQLLTAIEEERERLGRDLNDDLSQRLAAIAMMMGKPANRSGTQSRANGEKAKEISDLLADALRSAQDLSKGLHPVTLVQGIPAALAELAAKVPTDVEFYCPTSGRLDLDQSVAMHVYRIAEEAVADAIKHSKADKITIELKTISGRKVVLTIADNGQGFRQGGGPQGIGLQNMKYRAGVIEGNLKISTSLGMGTRVQCTLPLRRQAETDGCRL